MHICSSEDPSMCACVLQTLHKWWLPGRLTSRGSAFAETPQDPDSGADSGEMDIIVRVVSII